MNFKPSTFLQLQAQYANFVAAKQATMRTAQAAGRSALLNHIPSLAVPKAGDKAAISIQIPCALPVHQRTEDIERPLDDALRDMNLGLVDGGGTGLIGFSDITVIVHDVKRCLGVVLDVLTQLEVPLCTEVSYAARDGDVVLQLNGRAWEQVDLNDSIDGFLFMARMDCIVT
ncbi:MAG: hypothetical protein EON56_05600 [Alphaproteobacteria bacterium]|nr:MAG: hypothetical protein EON56_05600 [Alphaproteobacteria bacterium]